MASQKLVIKGKSISISIALFINGEFAKAKAVRTFGIENPATGKGIIHVQKALPEVVDEAVNAARAVFNSKSYQELSEVNRAKCLSM